MNFPYLHVKSLLKNIIFFPYLEALKRRTRNIVDEFQFDLFAKETIDFVKNLEDEHSGIFKFCPSSQRGDLYSTTYAILILGILGGIKNLTNERKKKFIDYLLAHQQDDGMFRDSQLQTELAEIGHSWGWYHLAPHIIIALDYLNSIPRYDFNGLLQRFKQESMSSWLESLDWQDNYLLSSNKIMNVGVLLQYSRDNFQNKYSGQLVKELEDWLLLNAIDSRTLIWGLNNNKTKFDISKVIKTIYHIVPIYIYDHIEQNLPVQLILHYALKTQNILGGYGPSILSDACEDIDSLYLLSRLGGKQSNFSHLIERSIRKFLEYVWLNRNEDGGFVFKRMMTFQYGDQPILSSHINESNIFATWFRTLSIAYAVKRIGFYNDFQFSKVPGYQF